jgi:ligand-binding sensor domain-containing protein
VNGWYRYVLWISVLLLTSAPDVRAERLPIKTYTTADGLAHNNVKRIVRDSRGFLWFCTADGLSRFDGYTFSNFGTDLGLPHSSVNDLLETRNGEYWVATNGGLVPFDPKGTPGSRLIYAKDASTSSVMFTVILPDDHDRRSRAITVLYEGRDGTIWAGTRKGLHRVEHTSSRPSVRPVDIGLPNDFPEQREIFDVLEDGRGSLIAAPSGLYRRWPDGTAARYTTRDGLPDDYLSDLLEDHEGQLWAGTRGVGFFRFRADRTRTPPVVDLSMSNKDGLPAEWVFQLFETADRRFWISTARGVAEFLLDRDDRRRFRSYDERNGLSYFDVTALNEDLAGNLWLGTNTAGAMKFTRGGFSTFGQQDGIETVNAVFEDRAANLCFRGTVLGDARTSLFEGAKPDPLGARQGSLHGRLGWFDGQRFDWFKPLAVGHFGWVPEQVTLQARTGEWWVGTGEGLYRFPAADNIAHLEIARPTAVYTVKDGLAAPQVYRLFEDFRGNVWVSTISATATGLARWERDTGRLHNIAGSPGLSLLKDDWAARSFGEDADGSVWIGFDGELGRYKDGSFTLFAANEGVPAGAIMNIHRDRSGRLWLASARGGLVRVDHAGTDRPTFVSYTTAQGLSSNNTEVITEDAAGHIYVGGEPDSERPKRLSTRPWRSCAHVRRAKVIRASDAWPMRFRKGGKDSTVEPLKKAARGRR